MVNPFEYVTSDTLSHLLVTQRLIRLQVVKVNPFVYITSHTLYHLLLTQFLASFAGRDGQPV